MNPFKYGCVVAGENYCRRPELQRQLSELVKSGQNVVVQGPRRMGKTSLVVETVKSLRGVTLLYVDLFSVRSVGEFCRKVVSATAKCGKRSFLERTAELVKGLRPVFSVDRDSGAPTISVDIKAARSVESVEEVMDMIAGHSAAKRLCVVFDEFQDVLDIPDSDAVLAALRSKIQFLPDTPFIFLGSVRNRMRDIFDSPKSPFFKSAISFGVERIDETAMTNFLIGRFKAGNRGFHSRGHPGTLRDDLACHGRRAGNFRRGRIQGVGSGLCARIPRFHIDVREAHDRSGERAKGDCRARPSQSFFWRVHGDLRDTECRQHLQGAQAPRSRRDNLRIQRRIPF